VLIKIFTSLLITSTFLCYSQKQLVLLRKESVLFRLYPGDGIAFKLKNSKRIWRTYINNLSDTSVVTHSDTIPFHTIERIYFDQSMFVNRLGGLLVVGGAALFLIDQFNLVVVNGNDPELNSRISTFTLSSIAVGLPMMLIKKKSQKLNHKHRLITVKEGSPFYRSDPKGFQSPFMRN
jgi:hypothetical protein